MLTSDAEVCRESPKRQNYAFSRGKRTFSRIRTMCNASDRRPSRTNHGIENQPISSAAIAATSIETRTNFDNKSIENRLPRTNLFPDAQNGPKSGPKRPPRRTNIDVQRPIPGTLGAQVGRFRPMRASRDGQVGRLGRLESTRGAQDGRTGSIDRPRSAPSLELARGQVGYYV